MPVSPLRFLVLALALPGVPTVASAQGGEAAGQVLRPAVAGRVLSAPVDELSGIVRSRRQQDLYWVHNDSGDSARIFAIRSDGSSVLPTYSKFSSYGDTPETGKQQWQGFEVLYAENVDWEDIALDENYLYLADIGNNANRRRDLAIYAVSEIDPTASTRSAVVQKWPVVYPDQDGFPPARLHFDAESLFTSDGELYVITKHRSSLVSGALGSFEAGAKLYRLDTRHTDRANELTLVDSCACITAATAADLSPDGSTLAVLSYEALYLFDRPADGDTWLSSTYRRIPLDRDVTGQAEAVAWEDADTLLIANEGRDIFRIGLAALPQP